jgi:flagellin-specific chaperone FliS
MIRRLSEANIQRDPDYVQDVLDCLESLNEGWKAITA